MTRKTSILLALTLLLTLTGCQLAQEDAQTAQADHLVGVCITNEYLSLFDVEAYLEDNWNGQENMNVEGNTRPYEGRIYAEDVSTDPTHPVYTFPGVDGVILWYMPIEQEDGEICWIPSDTPEAPFHAAFHVGDDMDAVTLTADLYVDCNQRIHSFYANPIYRAEDGAVYLMSGTGVSGDMSQPGTSLGSTLSEETTITIGEETTRQRTEIDLTFHAITPITMVALIELDADHHIISQSEYAAESIPDTYAPSEQTAYLIAETYREDSQEPERTLYSQDEETMLFYTDESNGYFIEIPITIYW